MVIFLTTVIKVLSVYVRNHWTCIHVSHFPCGAARWSRFQVSHRFSSKISRLNYFQLTGPIMTLWEGRGGSYSHSLVGMKARNPLEMSRCCQMAALVLFLNYFWIFSERSSFKISSTGCHPDRHLKYTSRMYKKFHVAYQVSVLPQTKKLYIATFARLKMSDGNSAVRLQLRILQTQLRGGHKDGTLGVKQRQENERITRLSDRKVKVCCAVLIRWYAPNWRIHR